MAPQMRFPFEIRPVAAGWSWRVTTQDGSSCAGDAPSRAAAAACVIRVLTEFASRPERRRPLRTPSDGNAQGRTDRRQGEQVAKGAQSFRQLLN